MSRREAVAGVAAGAMVLGAATASPADAQEHAGQLDHRAQAARRRPVV